ncbi:hypothetical protein CEXT_292441 [Caerostris extrusa]|uniref:Reverse transcriptase domain-containing protein n=1 Tax=Caerostris extrusa TaxID=172846 RepID=A0AAV4MYQ1_CAEEX|nr:hypothetical protein CEXT_292441 [Caerostris extrusa]
MDADVTPQSASTCLYQACRQNNVEHVKMLLKDGANINALDADRRTPLHFACDGGSIACLDFLLKMGADVHTPQSPLTPLHVACQEDSVECAEILLKYGANGAYDTIYRKRLLNKLRKIGVKDKMLNWIERWVWVCWNKVQSKFRQYKVGLPQGSVNSLSLLNMYVNNLTKRLKKTGNFQVSKFADHLVIWTEANNNWNYRSQQSELESAMNKALEVLQSWEIDNQMIINKF